MTGPNANQAKTARLRCRNECHYCGLYCPDDGCIDHVVPQIRGGVNAPTNLVWSCAPCNYEKGDSLPTCECDFCRQAFDRWRQGERHLRRLPNGRGLRPLTFPIADLFPAAPVPASAPDLPARRGETGGD